MPFSYRAFCRDFETPSLSALLVWLRQQGHPAQVARAWPTSDLMSSFWCRAQLVGSDGMRLVDVVCLRADAEGIGALTDELNDFRADIEELPDSEARTHVLDHLAATRALVIIEFLPPEIATSDERAEEFAGQLLTLFVERARGLAQRDGQGFLDEYDDVTLALG